MILNALYANSSGTQAATTMINNSSNNIANSTTTGYKTTQVNFKDLLYTGPVGGTSANGLPPVGTQLGTGTGLASTTGIFTQGTITNTDQQYDLAISGNGFFQVTLPDGTVGYTRDGAFGVNANNQLVTADGNLLSPTITIPPGTSSVTVASDGTVTATTQNGEQRVGQITLTNFQNPAGLARVGDNLFTESPASGAPLTNVAGTNGLGTIRQRALESSNVDVATELVNLIVAQQTFLVNSQAIGVENTVLGETSNLIP